MAAEARTRLDWEAELLRWGSVALEGAVFYLVLAAWARPRDGTVALLPLLACLALPASLAVRELLDEVEGDGPVRHLAVALAGLAWALGTARLTAPPGYWQSDASRGWLLIGVVFGGREATGLQPLSFWAGLLLWFRGQLLAGSSPSLDEALDRFRLGCLVVGAAVALAAADSAEGGFVQLEQALGVAAFLAAGLLTTSLSRRREMAGGRPIAPTLQAGQPRGRSRHRLAPLLVVAVALLMLGLAALGADAISPELFQPAVDLGAQALSALGAGLAALFGWLGGAWSSVPPLAAPPPALPPLGRDAGGPPGGLPRAPEWLGVISFLVMLLAAGVFAAALLVAIRRSVASASDDESHAVEGGDGQGPAPIEARGPVAILALVVRLFSALLGRPRAERAAPRIATTTAPLDPRVHSVREAYRRLLDWAAARGQARRRDETPDELRRRLTETNPAAETPIARLTDLYEAVRYGGRPATAADLEAAERALAELARDQ